MNYATKFLVSGLVILAGLATVACPDRTTIGAISANPSRYQDKEVMITGTVRDSYGVNIPGTSVRGGAYKIDDGTGSIWVVTDEGVPTTGALVGVKGIVGSGVNWKGKNYGLGLYEKNRKFRKR